MTRIDVDGALRGLREAIATMEAASDHMGCAWVPLAEDGGMRHAIVVGWVDVDGTDELHAKVARQPTNSVMQCDYDVDWEMPYDPATGEVWDTDVAVSSDDAWDEEWLVDQARVLAATGFDPWRSRGEAVA